MNRFDTTLITIAASALLVSACADDSRPTDAGQNTGPAASAEGAATETAASKPMLEPLEQDRSSPGKPQAPISINYDILSNPIVGAPVQINVDVQSDHGPVTVRYSISDQSALMFQDGQVESLEIRDPSRRTPRQVAVIPQREGRVYVNVSAEVQTIDGPMIRSLAIPIKVGNAPQETTSQGEVVEGPDGETVISLPAQESN